MDATSPPAPRAASTVAKAVNAVQWGVFAVMALAAAVTASDLDKRDVPGAPITYLYVCIAVSLVAALIHLPAVFRRLPRRAKWAAYIGILPVLALLGDYGDAMKAAYIRTPEGAREAAKEAQDAKEQAARGQAERVVADAKAAQKKVEGDNRKLEGCFSFFGHGIPKLTSQMKDSLENPRSFEYIRTDQIGDSTSPYNVQLFFRAENGFGAIRTFSVRAKINPDDCSVAEVTNIED